MKSVDVIGYVVSFCTGTLQGYEPLHRQFIVLVIFSFSVHAPGEVEYSCRNRIEIVNE